MKVGALIAPLSRQIQSNTELAEAYEGVDRSDIGQTVQDMRI